MTKFVAANEAGARVEPRKAMSRLTSVGKSLQSQDNLFMTEWVAISRECGLREDRKMRMPAMSLLNPVKPMRFPRATKPGDAWT